MKTRQDLFSPAPTTAKPKRASRKKKAEAEPVPDKADTFEETVTENAEEAGTSGNVG